MLSTRYKPGSGVCSSLNPVDCAACAVDQPNGAQRSVTSRAVVAMRRRTAAAYGRHPVLFVSEFLHSNFKRISASKMSALIVHNAVDTTRLDQVARKHVPAKREGASSLRLFAAGALFEYKGFAPMLAALVEAQRKCGRVMHLRIAGAGPMEESLRRQFEGPSIEFLGWSAYDDVLNEVLTADAVLVPSVCEESFATTILEALALGKSVLAMGTGGTPEMQTFADSAGGRLALFNSMSELAKAALALPATLRAAPRPLAFSCSLENMTDQVEAVYRSLLDKN